MGRKPPAFQINDRSVQNSFLLKLVFFNFHTKIAVVKELLYMIPLPSLPEYCFLFRCSNIARRY